MVYSLRYRSTRAEVWRWYWAMWRRSLWKLHLVAAIVGGVTIAFSIEAWPSPFLFAVCCLTAFPIIVVLLAAFPQIMFKPEERQLRIDEAGWSTEIGKKSGSCTWAEISEVAEADGALVIRGASGNAMIIPARALPTDRWGRFVADVCEWHRGNVA